MSPKKKSGKGRIPDRQPELFRKKRPISRRRAPTYLWWVAGLVVVGLVGIGLWWGGHTWRFSPDKRVGLPEAKGDPAYVGRDACTECHAAQNTLWQGSQHDLAMQEASAGSVLGDFNEQSFTYNKITSTFYTENGRYRVRTDGPEGAPQEYAIQYTFGVEPLQQYLIALPGGRLQALSIAWDTRPKAKGGQRWFHLQPNERVDHNDVLHWTQPSQNWNGRCATCHSTGLQKGYDAKTRSYDTRWSEIDVSCEACHGPGSDHVDWAKNKTRPGQSDPNNGLRVHLVDRQRTHRTINPETGNANPAKRPGKDTEIEICAPCHSRRAAISDDYVPGDRFLDHYRPAYLSEGLYYPDGQIQDEVYVYGSFLQSRMYHAGVTCGDCHEPHRLTLRETGSRICLRCHAEQKYKAESHHFHPRDSKGADCIGCHMPTRTYMVVDARHDHGFRIPRPDLSLRLGTPNACNQCHQEQSPEWAASRVKEWYGHVPIGFQRYANAFFAARNGDPNAAGLLADLIRDPNSPDIARATALAETGPYLRSENKDLFGIGLLSDNPMIRVATAELLERSPPGLRLQLALPLLQDPIRAVRIEAARVLAGISSNTLENVQRTRIEHAIQEYITAQDVNGEYPEAHVNLGILYANRGEMDRAANAYRAAIALSPSFIPAYINLADLYRAMESDSEGEEILREALNAVPESAEARYALALLLVRAGQPDKALVELRQAAALDPDNFRYAYTYAIALNSAEQFAEAIATLEGVHKRFPRNPEILVALITFNRDRGNMEAAEAYNRKLQVLSPTGR